MKSIQKNISSLTKKIILTVLIVVVVFILSISVMFVTKTGPFSKKGANNTTQTTSDNLKNTSSSSPTNSGKIPANNQPTDSGTSSNRLVANITYIRQVDSTLQIGTLIEDVASNGSCILTLTKDDKKVTNTVGVQALASSSTCKGFEVPIVELSMGTWIIKIDISTNSNEVQLSNSVKID